LLHDIYNLGAVRFAFMAGATLLHDVDDEKVRRKAYIGDLGERAFAMNTRVCLMRIIVGRHGVYWREASAMAETRPYLRTPRALSSENRTLAPIKPS
jgi:hypothetical protein